MITEPEMWEEPGLSRPVDLLTDPDDHLAPPSPGSARRRPWRWALGGVVAASLVWAGVLHGTGYGRHPVPDLHGYRLGGTPCTSATLAPLTDALVAGSRDAQPPAIHKGPALDHVSCAMTFTSTTGDGWSTWYVVTVAVDLHKKTDPRVEFEDTFHAPVSSVAPQQIGGYWVLPDAAARTRPYPGLGDLAYYTSGKTHQDIAVLHGGAVISLTLDSGLTWTRAGQPLAHADGSPQRPALVDTTPLAPTLPKTVRHLMTVLST